MKKTGYLYGILTALALLLVAGAGIGESGAYFTTYAEAQGGVVISLGDRTEIEEEFSAWTKHITITSEEESEPVWVRARAYSGSQYALTYTDESGGQQWIEGEGGWYYYQTILNAGETTAPLLVRISDVPEEVADGAHFNVVVVYETTPVLYREDGTPYADWTRKIDTGSSQGEMEKE